MSYLFKKKKKKKKKTLTWSDRGERKMVKYRLFNAAYAITVSYMTPETPSRHKGLSVMVQLYCVYRLWRREAASTSTNRSPILAQPDPPSAQHAWVRSFRLQVQPGGAQAFIFDAEWAILKENRRHRPARLSRWNKRLPVDMMAGCWLKNVNGKEKTAKAKRGTQHKKRSKIRKTTSSKLELLFDDDTRHVRGALDR